MPETSPARTTSTTPRKYVVSRTLDKVDWNNSTLIKGDVVGEITRLKGLDGPELQVHGSSNLIQTLLKHNLIDELHLWIFPVAIGNGKRLFGEGTNPSDFKLLESKTSSTGVIIATYESRWRTEDRVVRIRYNKFLMNLASVATSCQASERTRRQPRVAVSLKG